MDELRAAAERLRRVEGGEPADQAYRAHPRRNFQQFADQALLARAWLAANPADDGEPVTEEWLLSVGFADESDDINDGLCAAHTGSVDLEFMVSEEDGSPLWWLNDDEYRPAPATRGAVRRLCLALGIPLTEPA